MDPGLLVFPSRNGIFGGPQFCSAPVALEIIRGVNRENSRREGGARGGRGVVLRGAQHTQTGPTQTMPAAGVHLWKRLKSAILGKKRGPFFKKKALRALFSPLVMLQASGRFFCAPRRRRRPGFKGSDLMLKKMDKSPTPKFRIKRLIRFLDFLGIFSFYHFCCLLVGRVTGEWMMDGWMHACMHAWMID